MPIRVPTHLYRNRHGGFYFRYIVPKDLQSTVGKREVRLSLQTEQRADAIMAALQMIADLPRLAVCLRTMVENNERVPEDYFAKWREVMFQNTALKAKIDILKSENADLQERIESMVLRVDVKRYLRLAHGKGQLSGKRELELNLVFPWPPERTKTFSELLTAYMKSFDYRAEGGRKKPIGAKTRDGYEKDLEFFVKVMGDVHIGAIDREVTGEYFNILRRLPANIARLRKYREKTIPELLALNEPPQSEYNASKKLERASGMFKWALQEKRKWGIDANPFEGFGQSGERATKRRPFTDDELAKLLTHDSYVGRKFSSAYSYWLIPLAIFTGARLGELAQLDLKDFVTVEGIPCIDVNDIEAFDEQVEAGGRKKRVKTKNAKRLIPIHRELIRLGLLRYVEERRAAGQLHLFPELSRTRRDGPAHAASNWFGRYRKSVGIDEKQATVFHSFRHGFITRLLDDHITPHLLAPIVGHEAELVTGRVYWNVRDATKRKPTVEAFTLPDSVLVLLPSVEDVTFVTPGGPRTGRPVTGKVKK